MALLGVGSARGKDRASKAAHFAIHSPLFEISLDGSRSVLFNISGDKDLAMSEVYTVAKIISDAVDPDSKIIFGAVVNPTLAKGELKVTVIGAGFKGMQVPPPKPASPSLFNQLQRPAPQPVEVVQRKIVPEAEESLEEDKEWQDVPAFLRRKKPRAL